MELATCARPYARAAFMVAVEGKALSEWGQGLRFFAALAAEPRFVAACIAAPGVAVASAVDTLWQLASTPAAGQSFWRKDEAAWRRFLSLLLGNRRFALLPQISTQFDALEDEALGLSRARITSAYPLTAEQQQSILQWAGKAFQKVTSAKLVPEIKVDSKLMGGVEVAVGDWILDTSVAERLANLRHQVLNT